MQKLNVGIFNDSFPPIIDGVANTAVNYAKAITENYGRAVVATPWYPKVTDAYAFKVYRYSSANVSKRLGYRMGNPFNPLLIRKLQKEKLDIIHIHSPFTSALLARVLRSYTGAPIVFTYHTKFDVDIDKRIAFNPLKNVSIKFLLNNINACDEVWVVSEGAGENLKSLGYTGAYSIMENGTDFIKKRAEGRLVDKINEQHALEPDSLVFLFVGRMMWYKNLKFTIDGLKEAYLRGGRFRMLFVGEGADREEIMAYVDSQGMGDICTFTGAITDREVLRGYFTRADLFLFPSIYDTNGIVVREAAACYCPSLMIAGSCAAEGIEHNETGILIEDDPSSLAEEVLRACKDKSHLKIIGEQAAERIYISWTDAVGKAYKKYFDIIKRTEDVADEVRTFRL